MIEMKSFHCPKMSQGKEDSLYEDLILSTQYWLKDEGYEQQKHKLKDGGTLLQIKKDEGWGWNKFIGEDSALNIAFHQVNDIVNVEVEDNHWVDRAPTGMIDAAIRDFAQPVNPCLGPWQKSEMQDRIFLYIDRFLSSRNENSEVEIKTTSKISVDKTTDQSHNTVDVYKELIKLDNLRKRGIINEEEFATQKKKLLIEN